MFDCISATGDADGELKIWDSRNNKHIQMYKAHTGAIRAIKFSPDGRWIATGGADGLAKVRAPRANIILVISAFAISLHIFSWAPLFYFILSL